MQVCNRNRPEDETVLYSSLTTCKLTARHYTAETSHDDAQIYTKKAVDRAYGQKGHHQRSGQRSSQDCSEAKPHDGILQPKGDHKTGKNGSSRIDGSMKTGQEIIHLIKSENSIEHLLEELADIK